MELLKEEEAAKFDPLRDVWEKHLLAHDMPSVAHRIKVSKVPYYDLNTEGKEEFMSMLYEKEKIDRDRLRKSVKRDSSSDDDDELYKARKKIIKLEKKE